MFNIERADSGTYTTTQENLRFPLYTQVSAKPFDLSIVVYDANSTPPYSRTLVIPLDTTVDLELINAYAYDDNSSFFKCQNTDPAIIQQLPGGDTSILETIQAGESRLNLINSGKIGTPNALRNAAFRIWVLFDKNDTVVPHSCTDKTDNNCFENVYATYFEADDSALLCATECASTSTSGCYQCLRYHFATPICSRDNFAVKPASYRMHVSDTEESDVVADTTRLIGDNTTNDPTDPNSAINLSAGYKYKLEANATQWGSDNAARGYNVNFDRDIVSDRISSFNFHNITGAGCADTDDRHIGVRFDEGKISGTFNDDGVQLYSNNLFKHSNAGTYEYHIEDHNWTLVDQSRFEHKTFPGVDDCLPNDSSISANDLTRSGCAINSTSASLINGFIYKDMLLQFHPYQFNLGGIVFGSTPNDNGSHVYMNDLTKSQGMAITMDGNISAEGKDNIALSNFINNCASEDVNLWIDKNITHAHMYDPNTLVTQAGTNVSFQQMLSSSMSADGNLSVLLKNNFINTTDHNGSAIVNLYFNFEKPYADTVNPVDVNFTMLHAASPQATSSAHMTDTHIPNGNLSINQTRYFYFAKVEELSGTDNKQVYSTDVNTTLHVNTYCDSATSLINCGMLPGTIMDAAPWYRMSFHNPALDGQINLLSSTTASVTITPSTNVTFDTNGTTGIINIAYPLLGRPAYPVIVISPDEWLKYNPDASKNGFPEFTIQFLNEGLRWKGKGKTGHIIKTEPRINPSPRMNW
jgi:hypothetical protein